MRAEAIVEDEIQTFAGWLGRLEVLPTLTALRARGDAIVDGLLAENAGRWESLSERDAERVEALARAVVKRLLHEPTARVRDLDAEHRHARLRCCASCSASKRRRRPRPTRPPRSAGSTGDARSGSAPAAARWRWPRPASVARLLDGDVELVKITTAGDVDRARGDKSRWVGALEAALLAGEIDLAVHSAKDVPGELAAGTAIAATPRRAEPFDVRSSDADLREGARVGTSALRRRAQLLAARPDLEVVRAARERRHAAGQARGGRGRRARARRRRARPARPPRRGGRAADRRRLRARRRARA